MAVPKQQKPNDKIKDFVSGANADAPPKERKEPNEWDMQLFAVRIHPDIKYSIDQYQKSKRAIRAELYRKIIEAGMEYFQIPILERPKPEDDQGVS